MRMADRRRVAASRVRESGTGQGHHGGIRARAPVAALPQQRQPAGTEGLRQGDTEYWAREEWVKS